MSVVPRTRFALHLPRPAWSYSFAFPRRAVLVYHGLGVISCIAPCVLFSALHLVQLPHSEKANAQSNRDGLPFDLGVLERRIESRSERFLPVGVLLKTGSRRGEVARREWSASRCSAWAARSHGGLGQRTGAYRRHGYSMGRGTMQHGGDTDMAVDLDARNSGPARVHRSFRWPMTYLAAPWRAPPFRPPCSCGRRADCRSVQTPWQPGGRGSSDIALTTHAHGRGPTPSLVYRCTAPRARSPALPLPNARLRGFFAELGTSKRNVSRRVHLSATSTSRILNTPVEPLACDHGRASAPRSQPPDPVAVG